MTLLKKCRKFPFPKRKLTTNIIFPSSPQKKSIKQAACQSAKHNHKQRVNSVIAHANQCGNK